ncbi:GNAT family N-acetyltransferase [Paenibacillus dakarensis]|uniref:GNAT family N-acetyltransferase n=1 Tax=Paenibacillus dakarensis TaxID=1527293 RepID=UPI0006D52C29|nr:GNAT family N-acetyltransferase [Paenibacillus dakarensis]
MTEDNSNITITTDRLAIRLFHSSDAPEVARLCNNYNIYKNTLYLPYPYAVQDALSWISSHLTNFQKNKSYEFAITDKATGQLYGAIGLSNNQSFRHGEIAYWIGEAFWGKGYATEAAQAMLDYAFKEKKYHKVFARHFGSNPASGRVLQKIGMQFEGCLHEHVIKNGQYEDLVYYGIIEESPAYT